MVSRLYLTFYLFCVCRELKESQKGGKSIDLDSPNLLRMDTN